MIIMLNVDFSKNADIRGEGGVLKLGHMRTRGEGGGNGQKFADVLYGWPLIYYM